MQKEYKLTSDGLKKIKKLEVSSKVEEYIKTVWKREGEYGLSRFVRKIVTCCYLLAMIVCFAGLGEAYAMCLTMAIIIPLFWIAVENIIFFFLVKTKRKNPYSRCFVEDLFSEAIGNIFWPTVYIGTIVFFFYSGWMIMSSIIIFIGLYFLLSLEIVKGRMALRRRIDSDVVDVEAKLIT